MMKRVGFFCLLAIWACFSLSVTAEEAAAPAEGGHGAPAAAEGGHGGGGAEGEAKPVSDTAPVIKIGAQGRVFSDAEVEILQDLDQKRVELDRREQALELREKLVDMLEKKLADRVAELNQLKADLQHELASLSGKDDKELTQLSQIYGAMKPPVAAGVLNKLDNAVVFDVLVRMPVKKSGKIMEALDPVKARFISEMMAKRVALPVSGTVK